MIGRRLPDLSWDEYEGWTALNLQPGDYFKLGNNHWGCKAPNGDEGTIGDRHSVTVHEDGTITVSPSLVFPFPANPGQQGWHGWLERGIWRSC